MRLTICLAAAALSGCAASVAGLGEKSPRLTLESSRPAQQVAGCLATELQGTNPMVTIAEGHYVVARNNTYGMPMVRWDIFATATGSRLELRAQGPFGEGVDKARDCAGL